MALIGLYAKHPDELRADFQRYYGLNLDGMGVEYSIAHAAALAAHLPTNSASLMAEFPANRWTVAEYMLRAIEYNTRVLCWQKTKDGVKGYNKPKPLPTPIDEARIRKKAELTDFAEIATKLRLNIEGVDNGE